MRTLTEAEKREVYEDSRIFYKKWQDGKQRSRSFLVFTRLLPHIGQSPGIPPSCFDCGKPMPKYPTPQGDWRPGKGWRWFNDSVGRVTAWQCPECDTRNTTGTQEAIDFDGCNDSIELSELPDMPKDSFTISHWIQSSRNTTGT